MAMETMSRCGVAMGIEAPVGACSELFSKGGIANLEVHRGAGKAADTKIGKMASASSAAGMDLNSRGSSGAYLSSSGLQTFKGMRRPNAVDSLAFRTGNNVQPSSMPPPLAIRRSTSSSRLAVVAEVGQNPTELTMDSARAETESSNGHPKYGSESSTIRSDIPFRSFDGVVEVYRPAGSSRTLNRIPRGSSMSTEEIPSAIAPKKRLGKGVTVDRWIPPGSKLRQVKDLLERLEGVEPTDEGVNAALEGWDADMHPRDIIGIISNLRWKKARACFYWLKSKGYDLNVVVHNVLLGTFRAGKVWEVADEFGQQMIDEGLQLDNYTYSTLISCALQCNKPSDALKWFDKMDAAGCIPDEVTYSNMALVYSRLGRYDEAVALYERLKVTGWKPDKISFGTMVNVYSRGGNYYKASAVIREMQDAGIRPEAVVYNTLIKYFNREGKTGQAKRVFQDMENAGVKPTEYTLSLMVDVHGRAGETKEAFQLFTRMKEEKLPLDVVVYNSLMKMCAEEGLKAEAESLFSGMVGRGFKPDSVTYKSMVNLFAKAGNVNEAEKYANEMVETGLLQDVVVYSCLMKACGATKEFKRAAGFFDKMVADGCAVDDKCCGVLLSLLNTCETDEDRAIVIGCLRKSKPLLGATVDLLIGEEVNSNALQENIQHLLADSELDSHRPFCNALVDFCWSSGRKELARDLLYVADSLAVYPGGLRTKTNALWVLHLRSLSFNAAECGLHWWLNHLMTEMEQGKELPETLAIETGAGRNRNDVTRLFNVILAKLRAMGAPFEPTPERTDWIVAPGEAATAWLRAIPA